MKLTNGYEEKECKETIKYLQEEINRLVGEIQEERRNSIDSHYAYGELIKEYGTMISTRGEEDKGDELNQLGQYLMNTARIMMGQTDLKYENESLQKKVFGKLKNYKNSMPQEDSIGTHKHALYHGCEVIKEEIREIIEKKAEVKR